MSIESISPSLHLFKLVEENSKRGNYETAGRVKNEITQ